MLANDKKFKGFKLGKTFFLKKNTPKLNILKKRNFHKKIPPKVSMKLNKLLKASLKKTQNDLIY
jgi:hypothetical protein